MDFQRSSRLRRQGKRWLIQCSCTNVQRSLRLGRQGKSRLLQCRCLDLCRDHSFSRQRKRLRNSIQRSGKCLEVAADLGLRDVEGKCGLLGRSCLCNLQRLGFGCVNSFCEVEGSRDGGCQHDGAGLGSKSYGRSVEIRGLRGRHRQSCQENCCVPSVISRRYEFQ